MSVVRKIDSIEEFEKLKPIWNDLLGRSDFDIIFLTHEWLHTWWRVYGSNYHLYILAIEKEGDVVGLVPLMQSVSGGRKILQFIGTPNIDYCDLIGPDKRFLADAVISYLNSHRGDWDHVEFSQLPEGSLSAQVLQSVADQAGLPCLLKKIEACYSYVFSGGDDKRANFSLKRGSSLKRFINFFKKMDGLQLEQSENKEEIVALLPRFYHSHSVGWREKITGGKFENPQNRLFHDKLVEIMAPQKQLKFITLKHGNAPLAYLYAFTYKGRLNLYCIATENYYEKKSAGIILLHMLTEQAIHEGYNIVDFSRGEGSHKARFINSSFDNYQLTIYSTHARRFISDIYDTIKKTGLIKKITSSGTVSKLKAKIAACLEQEGVKGLIRHGLKGLFGLFFDYRETLIFGLKNKKIEEPEQQGEITIEKPGVDKIEEIASFLGFAIDSEKHRTIIERFSNGGICYMARMGNTIASIGWAVFKRDYIPEFEKEIEFAEDEVILSDSYTSPIYRGQGIYSRLTARMANEMLDRKLKVLAICYSDSEASQKILGKLGFTLESKRKFLRILGIRLI